MRLWGSAGQPRFPGPPRLPRPVHCEYVLGRACVSERASVGEDIALPPMAESPVAELNPKPPALRLPRRGPERGTCRVDQLCASGTSPARPILARPAEDDAGPDRVKKVNTNSCPIGGLVMCASLNGVATETFVAFWFWLQRICSASRKRFVGKASRKSVTRTLSVPVSMPSFARKQ